MKAARSRVEEAAAAAEQGQAIRADQLLGGHAAAGAQGGSGRPWCYDAAMKLPYGNADFHRLITHGFAYVDRTRYIRQIEELGEQLLFVRPRRFGKSLWLNTLANWYDLRTAGEHEQLFGGRAADRDEHRPSSAHNYFVLNWNFSAVGTRGTRGPDSVDQLVRDLDDYVLGTIEAFISDYEDHLPPGVTVDGSPIRTLTRLLAAIRKARHPLLLLIDEYDNFANDVMMTDEATYKGLVHADGPFKQLMKWVKLATEGQGLKRLFITGVTPVVLSDLTSGMNIAKNVSLEPELNALAGFTEPEIEVLLEQIVTARRESGKSIEISVDEALVMIRIWYNGYRFAPEAENLVYNPTLTLYYLDHLLRRGSYPRQMLDTNLAADENKLGYVSRVTAGQKVVVDLLRTDKPMEIAHLADRFTLAQMLQQTGDSTYLASFLYYFGMLTVTGETLERRLLLAPPNLVVRKLYLDKILELLLPAGEDPAAARQLGWEVTAKGELEPLLTFVEERLFPSFGRRDYLHMNELTVKTTFMALLFDDVNYVMLSEPTVLTPSVE
ncbi:MAG: AAA family ATPase, partial [bacterium]|nr:AAA family ATPase [bacterium]